MTAGMDDEAEAVIVTIDDSGSGVPREYRTAIFERGVSQRQGGTGHGLAFVREVVETEMRGSASCEESPLGGARFTLRLPVSRGKNG